MRWIGALLLALAVLLGALWVLNPGGVFNRYKNLSQVTVTVSDPIFENIWREAPQVIEGKMQILGHAVPHVYVWLTVQLHDIDCEWHTVFENRQFDLVALAQREENVTVNLEADNYDTLQLTVHRMLIVVETPLGATVEIEPAVANLVIPLPLHFAPEAGGAYQIVVDFSAAESIIDIDVDGRTADVEIKCVVAHREAGKSWSEIITGP